MFVLVLASSFLPIPGAAKIFTVRSGSMEPAIRTGSIILVRAADTYHVGDIISIALKGDAKTITHRVVAIHDTDSGPVFETKGDNNEEADQEQVPARAVIGKTLFTIPWLGYIVAYAQTKQGFLLLIAVPALLIIIGEVLAIIREARLMKEKRRSALAQQESPVARMIFSPPTKPFVHESSVPLSQVPPMHKRKIV